MGVKRGPAWAYRGFQLTPKGGIEGGNCRKIGAPRARCGTTAGLS